MYKVYRYIGRQSHMEKIWKKEGKSHKSEDDRIIFKICSPNEKDGLINKIVSLIKTVSGKMSINKLKLITTETKLFWITSPGRRALLASSSINILDTDIIPLGEIKFLGVITNEHSFSWTKNFTRCEFWPFPFKADKVNQEMYSLLCRKITHRLFG